MHRHGARLRRELEDAVRSAVALELLHNAFLVHDDVEDESDERRGRPTLHALHGVPVAVNVGDALTLLGLRALIDNRRTLGPWLTMRVLEEAERMARESVEGQAIELGWRRDNALDLSDADYLEMVLKKTCWYTTIYPSRVGALIGTRGDVDLDRFIRFGFFLGAAFQIQDDLLNLVGDPERYGKELDGDIWEGKRTLMLIHLLRARDRRRASAPRRIPRSAAQRRASVADVLWVRERMDAYGCLDYARQVAHGLAGAALHEFCVGVRRAARLARQAVHRSAGDVGVRADVSDLSVRALLEGRCTLTLVRLCELATQRERTRLGRRTTSTGCASVMVTATSRTPA